MAGYWREGGDIDMKLAEFWWRNLARSIRKLHKGEAGIVNKVVGLVIAALVVAWLVPMAVTALVGVDTSTWTEPLATIWPYIPAIIGIAILLLFLGYVKFRGGSKGD